ncbi:MAG: S8 family serine peptidase [Planctomycetes bacterium]|nr:S8 family serine peptidase [Planctomycetota bacterium]
MRKLTLSAPASVFSLLAVLGLAAGARAQRRAPAAERETASAPAHDASIRVLRAGDALPPPVQHNRIGEAPISQPALLDDAVPRELRVRIAPGASGDEVLSRSTLDPFYLSFAAGPYYPPEEERLDPEMLAQALQLAASGEREVHGFVMFSARITPERTAILESLGARVLGQHPYYCIKAALPIAALDRLARLEFVRWIGGARAQQKLHPNLALAPVAADGRIDVYIDVFESDLGAQSTSEPVGTAHRSDMGAWEVIEDSRQLPRRVQSHGPAQQRLETLGAEIVEYIEGLRAFRARVLPADIESIARSNFVQFVEPDIAPVLAHDESTPMIGNDIVRYYYSGNSSGLTAIGHADSGYDAGHAALSLFGWGWDFTGVGNPNTDGCEHGTHTLGSILGDGAGSYGASAKGVAPGLARTNGQSRAYIVRIFDNACAFSGTALSTIMSVNRSGYWDGVYTSVKPVAVNNSWGSPGIGWIGTEAGPRAVDDEVYTYDQLYVWAAGNEGGFGAQSIRQEATAKNALTVGSVVDWYDSNSGFPGSVALSSSRGPCGDGRWKPNVVAPGDSITSCDSGTLWGYRADAGTSMATPHVTGVAAEIADAIPWLRYEPAALASVLMSSAETKGGVSLITDADSLLPFYGAGRVEQHKAVLGSSDYYWNTWAFDAPWPNWQYADFSVPANTKRITVCMNYHESAASAGAGQALVNDWDLYIDDPYNGLDPAGSQGDWIAQQSARNNCEIRTLDNPTAGTWRWKVWPQNIGFLSTVKMGVTVTFEIDTAHCNPTFDVSTNVIYAQPYQPVAVSALATNFDGLASAAALDVYTTGTLAQATGGLFDGSTTNYLGNPGAGKRIELGDIPPYFGRGVDWSVSWPDEGVKYFDVYCDIDNLGSLNDTVYVTVDGTPPALPTGWGSFTHSVNTWSTNPIMYLAWNLQADNLSGVAGYAVASASGYVPDPGFTATIANVSTTTAGPPSSSQPFYVSMRPVDNAGNWNPGFVWTGPYYVDALAPSGPTGLHSTSHTVAAASCDPTIDVAWTPASDPESGVAGYGIEWDSNPSTTVSAAPSLPSYAASATSPALGLGIWFCHVQARDLAGNSGATQHLGPFAIVPSGVLGIYCTAKTNSLGCVSTLSSSGTPSATAPNGFVVSCSNVLNQKSGQLIYGLNGANNAPFQGGVLCVHPPVRRTVIVSSGGNSSGSDCSGVFSFDFNAFARGAYATAPAPELSVPGTLVNLQWWGRDTGFAAPNNTSLSQGMQIVICN